MLQIISSLLTENERTRRNYQLGKGSERVSNLERCSAIWAGMMLSGEAQNAVATPRLATQPR